MRTPSLLAAALALAVAGCSSPPRRAEAPPLPEEPVAAGPAAIPPPPEDARATWVVRTSLATPEAVDRVVAEARRGGFNTLFAQVRGLGDAWYASTLEPRAERLAASDFDPLSRLLPRAHAAGIRVHAWVNANVVLRAGSVPPPPGHLAARHPEWLQWPDALADALSLLAPDDPAIVRRLADHAREHADRVEGVYADPADPEYRAHLAAVCRDLVTRYPVQGIHLDYIRYPGPDWGFGRTALRELGLAAFARLRADRARFDSWRRAAVTTMVEDVARAVRAARPGVALSAAVFPRIGDARDRRFQDWTRWLDSGTLDLACPMIYTTDAGEFAEQAEAALGARGPGAVWPGIGAWRLEAAEIRRREAVVRRLGARGSVLFSHASLREKTGLLGP